MHEPMHAWNAASITINLATRGLQRWHANENRCRGRTSIDLIDSSSTSEFPLEYCFDSSHEEGGSLIL